MVNWDDVKCFLAAARTGSFKEAASRVGVDASTIGRRVQRLETALRRTLFVRGPGALRLTTAGLHLRDIAVRMETEMEGAAGTHGDEDIGGTIRISVPEGFGTLILAPEIGSLIAARPALKVELVTNPLMSPGIREVDIAITSQHLPMRHVQTELFTHFDLGLYGSADYIATFGPIASIADLQAARVIGYVEDLHPSRWHYLDQVPELPDPALSSNSLQAQIAMARAGCGIAILPHFIALGSGLERILPNEILLRHGYWISSHEEIASTARIRAVRRWVAAVAAAAQERLVPFASQQPTIA